MIKDKRSMNILVGADTRLIIQGITGREGRFHARQMLDYGTKVVAGVTPGKGGGSVEGIPVYNTIREAKENEGANTSIIFVPAKWALDAIYEAIDAKIDLIVCVTEGIPVLDMVEVYSYIKRSGSRLVGPNCPGIISPGRAKVGIMPGNIFQPGGVGVVSRSGALSYEIVYELTLRGIGQSTCLGIGGDPVVGTSFIDTLKLFEEDRDTEAIVLVGEIGGSEEENAAEFIAKQMKKPVVGYIAGKIALPERRMGHAGAIISEGKGTAEAKINAFRRADIPIADTPAEVARMVALLLSIHINEAWCKGCGICVEFCPNKVLSLRDDLKPRVANPGRCIQCGLCEALCPDFAISIEKIDEMVRVGRGERSEWGRQG